MRKPRTCPNCKFKFSLMNYLGKANHWLAYSSFKCDNCGTELQVDHFRRINIVIMMALWGLLVSNINTRMNLIPGINDLWVLLPVFFIGIFFIWSFESFREVNPEEK